MSDWAKLKVVDLKAELKRRDLPQHGLKAELVARLEESDTAPAEVEEDAAAQEEPEQQTEPQQTGMELEEQQTEPVSNDEPAQEPAAREPEPEPEPEPAQPEPEKPTEPAPEPTGSQPAPVPEEVKPTDETAPFVPPSLPHEPTIHEGSDTQKRKRRSASPPIDEEEIAHKKARAAAEGDLPEPVAAAPAPPAGTSPGIANEGTSNAAPLDVPIVATGSAVDPGVSISPVQPPIPAAAEMDLDERDIAPAQHPATSALYISNLMRPLRPADVQAHIASLAAAPGQAVSDDVIATFFLDQIRTHAFVVLSSANAAARVRSALHDRIWPNESNRKPLAVDFVPPEKVASWIEMEDGNGGGRSTARWEVAYEPDADGIITARLQQANSSISGPSGPRSGSNNLPPSNAPANAGIPTGPRGGSGGRDNGPPPSGPRKVDDRPPPPPRNAGDLSPTMQQTRARPSISFQLTSAELAKRRLDNMRSFYTLDRGRPLGREINRYSFESGAAFVDRGKEIFEGIRPPHRERGRGGGKFGGRGRGGGGGGRGGGRGRGGGFRPKSDRYLPGLSGGGGGGRMFDEGDWERDRRP